MMFRFLCATLLLMANVFCLTGAIHVNSLDPEHKIQIENDPTKSTVTVLYEGKQYNLDENTLYLDCELKDEVAFTFPYIYNNVRDALDALNVEADSESIKTLYIAPGVYWVDDPDSPADRVPESGVVPYGMIIDCPHLALIGMTQNPENVVLACNRGQTQGAVGNFTMLRLNCKDIEARNITFGNYCNVDLKFPLNKEYNRAKRNFAIVQAQLIHTDAEKVFAQNCRFISRLNLSPFIGSHRTLFDNCEMECTEDALHGSAVYHNCRLTFYSSRPMMESEAYGAVFLGCEILSNSVGTQYFCKNNGGIVLIDTQVMPLRDQKLKLAFNYNPNVDSWYYSNVTIGDKPQQIPGGVDISDLPLLKAFKVDAKDGSSVYNIANLMAGDDQWDPLNQREIIPAEYLNIPVMMQISSEDAETVLNPLGDTMTFSADFFRWGGYKATDEEISKAAESIDWQKNEAVSIVPTGKLKAELLTTYRVSNPFSGLITARASSGLQGKGIVKVAPYFNEAPSFVKQPTIELDPVGNQLVLNYTLEGEGVVEDQYDYSDITWFRYTQDNLSDTIPVRWSIAIYDGKIYPLTAADRGSKILAVIHPRFSNSYIGMPKQCRYTGPIDKTTVPSLPEEESYYATNFYFVPVYYQPKLIPGAWTFDAYKPLDTEAFNWDITPEDAWFYGEGVNGMTGIGLIQSSRGARCFYTPVREKCSDMKAIVRVDPGKTSGQGFGSATAQYLDICIKFDSKTLTGYALRIERIPDQNRAVQFQFIKYTNGKTERIGKAVLSNCFVSTCTIEVEVKGRKLIAKASSDGSLPAPNNDAILPEVFLEQTIQRNPFAGFCLQHTGTTGASAAMIHDVSLIWK